MRIALVLAGSLLLGSIGAQSEAAPPKPQDPVNVTAEEAQQQLQELQQKAITDWRASLKAARNAKPEEGKPMKAMSMRPDFGPVAKKAYGFAKKFAGTDDAVPFLMMVVQMSSDKEEQKSCIEQMLKSHIDSPELAQMGGMIEYLPRMIGEEAADAARMKMLNSNNADVRGWALLATYKSDIEKADRDGEKYDNAKKALLAAAERVDDPRLKKEMTGAIDMREKFGVGCEAPDIAGIDLDGVEFKLSDYKGKVIFLDFWGDW